MNLEISNNKNNNSISNDLSISITAVYSIDRFEGDFAVCENTKTGEMINIKKELLPPNAKEGSIIKFENGNYILDIELTKEKQEKIKNMVNNLFKK